MTHLPHPTDDDHALCGKYITRANPVSTDGSNECLQCQLHVDRGTAWDENDESE